MIALAVIPKNICKSDHNEDWDQMLKLSYRGG